MAKINVLEKQVAELIAAGEVVERPASIVKELVENAVDAGSTAVTVEIQGGGIRFIRVTDNGSGIEREDIANAFLRHATSKVRVSEDLNNITTMGFRGEALASIAAMCRVEVLSRTKEDIAGTLYAISGGEEECLEDAGCPVGTTFSVRDVFFNTPARMKFLKKDSSEGNSVAAVVEKAALSNPAVAFKFIRDGAVKLQTPGDGQLISAVRCIFGREFAENTIPVHYTNDGITVDGFICKPSAARGSRSFQNFFINARFVRSKTCMAALEEAYRNSLMVGKYPTCVLNLTIPPHTVDVNVHPAKIEVRFADEKSIFNLVYYGCKTALGASRLQPEIKASDVKYNPFEAHTDKTAPVQQRLSVGAYKSMLAEQMEQEKKSGKPPVIEYSYRPVPQAPPVKPIASVQTSAAPYPTDRDAPEFVPLKSDGFSEQYDARRTEIVEISPVRLVYESELPPQTPNTTPAVSIEPVQPKSIYENAVFIGELFDTYLVLQNGDDMLLVDKHAAHERILYNRLIAGGIAEDKQLLITPVSVRLSPDEHAVILENEELLSKTGLTVEDFGDSFVVIREIAPVLSDCDLPEIVLEFANKLLSANSRLLPQQLENLYHTIACKAAIKAHDKTSTPSLEQLIVLLKEDGDADHCPHGRPIAIKMTQYEIAKKFGRLG
ncbi:DNA mismatch repair endonuclease MutL [Oscillospiraceae bacterium PP1C4]